MKKFAGNSSLLVGAFIDKMCSKRLSEKSEYFTALDTVLEITNIFSTNYKEIFSF